MAGSVAQALKEPGGFRKLSTSLELAPDTGSSAPRLCRQTDHRICTVLAGAVVLPTWRPGRGDLLRPGTFWQAKA
jgi:hypothetical protein